MVYFLPTHVVDVLTGTVEDALGDVTDGTTVAASGIPVSILERTRRVFRQDSDNPRTVRYLTGRCPAGTPVAQGDRLRDTTDHATTWVVDAVSTNSNPITPMDTVLDLRRI